MAQHTGLGSDVHFEIYEECGDVTEAYVRNQAILLEVLSKLSLHSSILFTSSGQI